MVVHDCCGCHCYNIGIFCICFPCEETTQKNQFGCWIIGSFSIHWRIHLIPKEFHSSGTLLCNDAFFLAHINLPFIVLPIRYQIGIDTNGKNVWRQCIFETTTTTAYVNLFGNNRLLHYFVILMEFITFGIHDFFSFCSNFLTERVSNAIILLRYCICHFF